MAIELTDDGTLDTVLRCSECGEEFRYNYDPSNTDEDEEFDAIQADDPYLTSDQINERLYADFVAWAIEDATADHECPSPYLRRYD